MRATVLFLSVFVLLTTGEVSGAAAATHDGKSAEAGRMAAEASWAEARDLYAEALKLAPNEDAARWTRFRLADATWRAAVVPQTPQRPTALANHLPAIEALLPEPNPTAVKDEYTAAVLESRADFLAFSGFRSPWPDRLLIANYYADLPPQPDVVLRFISFLKRSVDTQQRFGTPPPDFILRLEDGARVATLADDRAWCAIQAALLTSAPPDVVAARWSRARATAAGTAWAAHAAAGEFAWRAASGWDPDAVPNSPANFPALLAELNARRAPLDPAAKDPLTARLRGTLAEIETEWNRPQFSLAMPDFFSPRDRIAVSLGTAGFASARFQIVRLTPAQWTTHKSPAPGRLRAAGSAVRSWSIVLPNPESRAWHAEIAETAPLEPGFYTLRGEASGPGGAATSIERDFVVSDIHVSGFLAADGSGSVFAFDPATGQPAANAAVQGEFATRARTRSFTGRTDASGLLQLSPEGLLEGQTVITATVGNQPAWLQFFPQRENLQILVDTFLDRPLFRPGETVKWKLILRERQGGTLVVPKRALRMTVQLGEEKLIDNRPMTLGAFGTLSGEIIIPRTARPGQASLLIEDMSQGNSRSSHAFFIVDNYVPPALSAKLSLASGADSLRPGREMVVRADVSYLSGGPAGGAAVEFTFSNYGVIPFDPNGQRAQGAYTEWQRQISAVKAAVTDADGVAESRIPLPAFLPPSSTMEVNARVIPEGGQPVAINRSFTVTGAGAILNPGDWTQTRLVRPGEPVTFRPVVQDGAGEPRRFTGMARLVERRWTEAWLSPEGEVLTGPSLAEARRTLAPNGGNPPAPWRVLQNGVTTVSVAEKPVAADASGALAVEFTPPREGIFQLQLVAGDQVISPTYGGDALTLVAADERTRSLSFDPRLGAIFGPGKLTANQPYRVLLVLPEANTRGATLSVQGDAVESTRHLRPEGRVAVVSFDRAPDSVNSVTVISAAPGPVSAYSSRLTIPVDHEANRLAVEILPGQDVPRPGSESTLRVVVKDAAGRPVRAELGLGGSDEAVNALSSRAQKPEPAFWRAGAALKWAFYQNRVNRSLSVQPDYRRGAIRNRKSPQELTLQAFGGGPGGRGGGGGGRGGGGGEAITLNPFEVSSEIGSFQTASVGTGSRLNLDPAQSPAAYAVINREFIQALGITDMSEAASWAPGATFGSMNVQVRQHFASTALWAPALTTDDRGEATVKFTYPDNLTQWRFEAYAVGSDAATFGRGQAFTRASMPLQSRLQLPRFLVAGDRARGSALLVNRSDATLAATVALAVQGSAVKPERGVEGFSLAVPAQGEARAPLVLDAASAGPARISIKAAAGTETDGMSLEIPVLEDGLQQLTAATGRLAPRETRRTIELPLPAPLDRARTGVRIQLSPSYAATLLDALPYLVDYPYGCVEQTMNRFLPAVVVRKSLIGLGLDAAAVEQRILGRESPADAARRRNTAGLGRLDEVVQLGVSRILESVTPDGGFGWWPGAQSADPWMTAYVMWGATLAAEAGVNIPGNLSVDLAQGAVEFINNRIRIPVDIQGRGGAAGTAYLDGSVALMVAAAARVTPNRSAAGKDLSDIFDRLFAAREKLPAAGRACLLMAARTLATPDQLAVLMRNLENGIVRSNGTGNGDTAHWGATSNYWHAMDGAAESTALYVLALLDIDPRHALIEPAINWLLLTRRSAHWDSTRSTAFAVLALARAIEVRKENQSNVTVELRVNGQAAGRFAFTRASLLEDLPPIDVDQRLLRAGSNRIELVRTAGDSPVYLTALGSAWATGDGVRPAGNLIGVSRTLDRMKPQPTVAGTVRLQAETLGSAGAANAGEQVTARVQLNLPNQLEYVMVEVPKPAGCEPLNALSGWDARLVNLDARTGSQPGPSAVSGRPIYREERDDKTVFFLDRIDAGNWEIRYGMRAVTPGDFRVLPAAATAMYVPEVRANSDARRITIAVAE